MPPLSRLRERGRGRGHDGPLGRVQLRFLGSTQAPARVTESAHPPPLAPPSAVRVALYRRLRWLWPFLARAVVRRALRLLGWGLLAGWLLLAALIVLLRYVVLPQVGNYKGEIEQEVGRLVGQSVSIGHIAARWEGINPDLVLGDVRLLDADGKPAFTLARVDGVFSWQTLLRGRPVLALLAFDGPVLHIRRDRAGNITVAGMPAAGGDSGIGKWVLEQKRIRIRDATIIWEDELRGAPPLLLKELRFGLDNRGRRHRFGLAATPPAELAAKLDIRGDVTGDLAGNPGAALGTLAGKLFVQLDYADLAGWRAWLDYPVDLPQGRGALRVWADLANAGGGVTADLALQDLRLRLAPELPELDLASLRGRLEARYRPGEWSLRGAGVELRPQRGAHLPPTDFFLDWHQETGSGQASANRLDLGALTSLAGHLPLDPKIRELLDRHQPRGQVRDLRADWSLADGALDHVALKAAFSGLGMLPGGVIPGGGGLDGRIELSDKGGELALDSRRATLSLPAVFAEPDLAFDMLRANARWTVDAQGVDVRLSRLEFAAPDAAGEARGNYRYGGGGPGVIDLQATLARVDGRAVWRYMPLAVSADVRAWLRRGITGGRGVDGKLILQGDLADFPFRDGKSGRFSVTARAAGVRLDYAEGWPAIEGIEADMQFGLGMKITAKDGRLLGARLSGVSAAIPDFESADEMLLVRGAAAGPTASFLDFIGQSPVAASIDRFTDGMKAKGDGHLDLELDLPLRDLSKARIAGRYRFQNNELEVFDGLPPLTQVNGLLTFSDAAVNAQGISGRAFGGPLRVDVRSAGDKVSVTAKGTAGIAEAGRHFAWPLLDRLSGNAAWRADIDIHKRNAELRIASDLVGVASTLPEPLNKTGAAPLPLRIERKALDGGREQYRVTLGGIGRAVAIRNGDAWERGALALGDGEARPPGKGLAVRVALPRLDLDAWRAALPPAAGSAGGLELAQATLATPRLRLMGRDYNRVNVDLRPADGGWQIGIDADEMAGDLLWRSGGEGWIGGHLRRLYVHSASDGAARDETAGGDSLIDSLPGMSLVADDFRIDDMALGRLEVKAANTLNVWRLDTLSLRNADGALNGKAVWANTGRHQTQLEFDLDARDAGKLLDRLGYADTVRRGAAALSGKLQWNGPLTRIHYPSLSGQMRLHAEKGQFNQIKPGVGKLLGLISLQSLPRRLSLDFRDIFSDGLAFDSIQSQLTVDQGIMRTVGPLRIAGPAAQIEMEGEADLQNETQNLHVVVRPEVGGLAAVGAAAAINPVAGAAVLLANTVLKRPFNRLVSYRYHVTGSWNDPQVNKAGQDASPETPPENRP